MKIFILLSLLCSTLALAQETLDVSFINTQRAAGSPFNLPISINSKGQIAYFGNKGTDDFALNPFVQLGYQKTVINYSQPVVLNRFNFYPIQKNLGWIEVKRQRIEAGLGLSALIKSTVSVGLIPYKGALQTIVRHKASQTEKSLPFKMPTELSDIQHWNIGDFGTFQTYGGLSFYLGAGIGVIDFATLSTGIQNQFIIEIKKVSEDKVLFSLREEDMTRRQAVVGPMFINGVFGQFSGKRFGAEFTLDLNEPLHQDLFRVGIRGDIRELQEQLPFEDQKQYWDGQDSSFYVGIPWVIGKTKMSAIYEINEDETEVELQINGTKNSGLLKPLRNLSDYAYHTEKNIVLVWTSEMTKATPKAVEKSFLSKGKILGVKGFDREYPKDTRFGSTISQIGLELSKTEIEKLQNADLEQFEAIVTERCVTKNLPCKKMKKRSAMLQEFTALMKSSWIEMNGKLASLLVKEPVLIHGMMKILKNKKEVYFKFLSEKYQSLEGSSTIEI